MLLKLCRLVLRRTQQAAGRLDIFAARGAGGRVDAFGGQSSTERDHGPVVGGEIGRSGNFMETDQVDPALQSPQEARQFPDVPGGVIHPAEQNMSLIHF